MSEGPRADEVTLEKMRAIMRTVGPTPRMPHHDDLTPDQRRAVEQTIEAVHSFVVREFMWAGYYQHRSGRQANG